MNAWLFLFLAIVCEVIGSTALKASAGFSKIVPSSIVIVGYGLAFYFLSLSLKAVPLSVAYAVWSGLGTALIVILGIIFLKEPSNAATFLGVALIIAGVVILNLFAAKH